MLINCSINGVSYFALHCRGDVSFSSFIASRTKEHVYPSARRYRLLEISTVAAICSSDNGLLRFTKENKKKTARGDGASREI